MKSRRPHAQTKFTNVRLGRDLPLYAVLFKVLGILVVLASFLLAWLVMDLRSFAETPLKLPGSSLTVTIAPGSGLRQLANLLEKEGAITRPSYFVWLARWKGASTRIQAGEYRIEAGTTASEFIERAVSGAVAQYALTLVEGWTFRQVLAAVRAEPRLQPTLLGLDDAQIMAAIGAPGVHPEGRFYPDTYHFPSGMTDADFLKRAYQAMATELAAAWANRDPNLPLKTPDEALVLASIVERETGLDEERRQVAGVFIRRMRKGMRLQTDPTVIYGLGESFNGNLTREHLLTDTPYNTYTRRGLPPSPIAMPGRASLEAAVHPDDGESLYFVSRRDGSHHFSATLEEHVRAVRDFQLTPPTPR